LCGKEGLALMNGTHFMAAHGCAVVGSAGRLMDWLDSAAALSYEALACSPAPLDPRVHQLRGSFGQQRSAATILGLLGGSLAIRKPGEGRQDPYSVRCAPQVHGSCRDVVEYLRTVVTDEVNAVTDNPLILPEWPHIVENGNFHGQRIAVAFDTLRNALADAASISERRTFALLTAALSNGLPPFLATRPASSGFMMVQYTAASLVSQLKHLAAPISCDSIPTSGGQEDHVSMGMAAARLAVRALEMFEQVVAIELMCAARAIDLRGARIGTGTNRLLRRVRTVVEPMIDDRPPGPDIERLASVIRGSKAVVDDVD
jgi:histidine ammonia-lyase